MKNFETEDSAYRIVEYQNASYPKLFYLVQKKKYNYSILSSMISFNKDDCYKLLINNVWAPLASHKIKWINIHLYQFDIASEEYFSEKDIEELRLLKDII